MEALKALSTFFVDNSLRSRRNLRGDIEKRSLAINESFESAFREVKEVSWWKLIMLLKVFVNGVLAYKVKLIFCRTFCAKVFEKYSLDIAYLGIQTYVAGFHLIYHSCVV